MLVKKQEREPDLLLKQSPKQLFHFIPGRPGIAYRKKKEYLVEKLDKEIQEYVSCHCFALFFPAGGMDGGNL